MWKPWWGLYTIAQCCILSIFCPVVFFLLQNILSRWRQSGQKITKCISVCNIAPQILLHVSPEMGSQWNQWFFWRRDFCFVHLIFSSFGFWYFGHFSCVIFFPLQTPSCLAKCKQRLCNIFVTLLPKVTKNQIWDERNINWWHEKSDNMYSVNL